VPYQHTERAADDLEVARLSLQRFREEGADFDSAWKLVGRRARRPRGVLAAGTARSRRRHRQPRSART